MKFPVKTTVALLVLGGAGYAAYTFLPGYWSELRKPNYRQAEVTRGPIVSVVNSTGTVQPVQSVSVGSLVSGPVKRLFVDFNAPVKKDDLLAEIDPRLYEAAVARDKALLATRKAELESAKALLQKAKNDEQRALMLHKQNRNYISGTEMDQFKFNRMSLEAQTVVARANVEQAEANMKTSEANLAYTKIRSPVNGTVINRKIDEGQTLASQFQTPELFVVAPDMKTMHILASVDEADIGLIREAQFQGLPVTFTVDAYPDDLFEGTIAQVRMNSTTTQNVVTYPVIVAAPNPELKVLAETTATNPKLKLMPGMTASLSFQVAETRGVLRIPNAALRFFPKPEQVRPEDRKLLEGSQPEAGDDRDSAKARLTAQEKAEVRKKRYRRHVWVVDGDFLRAVEVTIGLSDNRSTELVSGDLAEGQSLVTGIQPRE